MMKMLRVAATACTCVLLLTGCTGSSGINKHEILAFGPKIQLYYVPPRNLLTIGWSTGDEVAAGAVFVSFGLIGAFGYNGYKEEQLEAMEAHVQFLNQGLNALDWPKRTFALVQQDAARVPWLDAAHIIVTEPDLATAAKWALVSESDATGAIFAQPILATSSDASRISLVLKLEKFRKTLQQGAYLYDTKYLVVKRDILVLDGGTTAEQRNINGHRRHAMTGDDLLHIWLSGSPSRMQTTLDTELTILSKNLSNYLTGQATDPDVELPEAVYTLQ